MVSNITIEIDQRVLIDLVCSYIQEKTGNTIEPSCVKIETKSKQNYRSEWERADFRATYSSSL